MLNSPIGRWRWQKRSRVGKRNWFSLPIRSDSAWQWKIRQSARLRQSARRSKPIWHILGYPNPIFQSSTRMPDVHRPAQPQHGLSKTLLAVPIPFYARDVEDAWCAGRPGVGIGKAINSGAARDILAARGRDHSMESKICPHTLVYPISRRRTDKMPLFQNPINGLITNIGIWLTSH